MSVFLIMFFYRGTAFGAQAELPEDLTELSIEELLDIEVTLASRKPQKISQTAAAVFVITDEDIRRSGAASIPELLRTVPGLQVARISSSKWAVTSRGFNNIYANKLLILIDGRTVYSPLFSGVFWDVQDTFLEDVDRIEVIRGPGASLWGANAVNGIINIKTKHAEDTEGGLVYAGFGKEEKKLGGVRYGGKTGKKSYYRIYTKYADYDGGTDVNGDDASDDWDMLQAGFRMDNEFSDKDAVILQGEIYRCETDETLYFPSLSPPYMNSAHDNADKTGGNIMGRWKHSFSDVIWLTVARYLKSCDSALIHTDCGFKDFRQK
ncbi:TonB-dependent receptor plug domain-containing protein [Desulfococcaceae bacterium HSG9]|nr:TonB-dependent receptor plug domain-containing protein [Desulfococcaceae bacterium HSG9]